MLNIDEYNESLYRSIDKRNKRKNIIQNYSGYLAHATQDENHLEHHKYIDKIGDRYIYPEDVARKKKRKPIIATQQDIKESVNTNRQVKATAEQQAKDKKDIFEAKTQEEANKAVEDMRNREKSEKLLVVKKTTTPKMTKEEREELLKKQRLANKLAAKHSAFDISDKEMNNYLMHGSVNGLKSVETEKSSEESEDQKKTMN